MTVKSAAASTVPDENGRCLPSPRMILAAKAMLERR